MVKTNILVLCMLLAANLCQATYHSSSNLKTRLQNLQRHLRTYLDTQRRLNLADLQENSLNYTLKGEHLWQPKSCSGDETLNLVFTNFGNTISLEIAVCPTYGDLNIQAMNKGSDKFTVESQKSSAKGYTLTFSENHVCDA